MTIRNLDKLLHPRSVAVIGGSDRPGSIGHHVLANVLAGGFAGPVHVVNPRSVAAAGARWSPSVAALPEAPDLAILATPAAGVPRSIGELGELGTKAAVVISAGFQDGALRADLLAAARPHLLRIVGPNCLGVMLPRIGLNASFAPAAPRPGGLALVSQSGALVTAMLDWAADEGIGFSSVFSVGDMADVDLGDLVDLLAADPATDAILLYVEGVTSAAKFLSAARAASRVKPVVAIKAGRSAAAGKAARSHTGALAGAWDVHAAAFRRAGIVMVETLSELFDAAQLIPRAPVPAGNRLAIVTNGGGAGVLAADALARVGGTLAPLAPSTLAALDARLPANWSRANPIDVVGDAQPERFAAAIAAVAGEVDADALLVIHCPTAVAPGTAVAQGVAEALRDAAGRGKPVIACWLGSANARAARAILAAAGIPLFDNLDEAIRGFGYLIATARARAERMRAPAQVSGAIADRKRGRAIVHAALEAGRTMLTAPETLDLLAAYGVPVVASRFAADSRSVATACEGLTPPFAVKLVSTTLTHKSDVGAVRLGLDSVEAAAAAAAAIGDRVRRTHPEAAIEGFEVQSMVDSSKGQELLLGIADDPIFGPVLAFGAGGKAVEVLADRALELPPLDDALAGAMIDATRIGRLLRGYRDVPAADRAAIVRAIQAVAAIAVDHPEIAELDINPLIATANGVIALDGRARLIAAAEPRLAIRPVPVEWTADLVTRGGVALHVRPVVPQDEALLADLFANMSAEDLRFRFLTQLREVERDRLVAMAQVDYRRTMNFLAFADGRLVASAMLAADPDRVRAELAVAVRDGFKGKGVSWTLVEHVLRYARAEGIEIVESVESRENHAALALEQEAGFVIVPGPDGANEVIVRRHLA